MIDVPPVCFRRQQLLGHRGLPDALVLRREDITLANVLLREDGDGGVGFEYDRPACVFGQYNNNEVDAVARKLDHDLQALLEAAAA